MNNFDFSDRLLASEPFAEYMDKLMTYGQFVGSWDVDGAWYSDGQVSRTGKGEWHFHWILGGRGIQDVLHRTGALPHEVGTTLRCYDASIDAWHIAWMHPASGEYVHMIGRRMDHLIVQEGIGPDPRRRERWIFSEITPASFSWRGEVSLDDGASWILEQTIQAVRRQ